MRFLFLIHGDTEAEAAMTAAERHAIVEEHMAVRRDAARRSVWVLGAAPIVADGGVAVEVLPHFPIPRRRKTRGGT